MKFRFSPGNYKRSFAGCFVIKAVFQQKAKPDEMQSDGLNALGRELPGMLHCIGIDGPAMCGGEFRVRVFARQYLTINLPAARRRFHITVDRPRDGGHKPAAANTSQKHLRHT